MLQLILFITYSNYVVTDSTRPSILAFENDVAMTAKKIDRFLVPDRTNPSANQSILLALAAMLNIRLERKTDTL
jgi:hypothetical protein